ncbi:glycohydrolase toxin TNT-related protein [Propionibacterium acidifaciens]|nr:DUF4237 domain-containing protein [Propionibacterium acidifaciens]
MKAIVKPIPVQTSRIALWFGEPGGGIQHELPVSAQKLLDHGIIKEVTAS